MFKVNIKTPERRQSRRSGVFIVNFAYISHLVVVFLLLTLSTLMPAENPMFGHFLNLDSHVIWMKSALVIDI